MILTKANPGAVRLPFLLDGVGGDESLNQKDQIHPTAAGHRKVAELGLARAGTALQGAALNLDRPRQRPVVTDGGDGSPSSP